MTSPKASVSRLYLEAVKYANHIVYATEFTIVPKSKPFGLASSTNLPTRPYQTAQTSSSLLHATVPYS